MKICFLSDLHLGYNKNAIQYEAFDFACDDIFRKKPDVVVVAGDITSDGNIFAAKRFIKKIYSLHIPVVIIPGNSDFRTPKNVTYLADIATPLVARHGDITFFALRDASGHILPECFTALEKANDGDIVVMHHPIEVLDENNKKQFLSWRAAHPKTLVFHGHMHKSASNGTTFSLQTLDPDKAIGENPGFMYYDTETGECEKQSFFCPMPSDLMRYVGIVCYDPLNDLKFSAEHKLTCAELSLEALNAPRDELYRKVSEWRKSGGVNLSLRAPEVTVYMNGITEAERWDRFVDLAMYLGAERVVLSVPTVTLETMRKNRDLLGNVVDFLTRRFTMLPDKCTIGVENMHMSPKERSDMTRRFGYLPEECVSFMKRLQEKCPRRIGLDINVGHIRNNRPFQDKYQLSTWYVETGRFAVGYHLHQVEATATGLIDHRPFTEPYDGLISLASFFRTWSEGILNHAPVILDIKGHGEYAPTVAMLEKQAYRNVFDLHSHTQFSDCGVDRPERVVTAAIENGIRLLGISDHSYGIGERLPQYVKKIRDIAPKYNDRIKILCGIELPTVPELYKPLSDEDASVFDYALIEHITNDDSVVGGDLLGFCQRLGLRCGIAHTDLFAYCKKYGYDPTAYFSLLAKAGIFWEMNMSYDSVHFFRKHGYVEDFVNDEEKQRIVREAGLHISIGSDCHRKEEYVGERVHRMYDFLKEKNIPTADVYFE